VFRFSVISVISPLRSLNPDSILFIRSSRLLSLFSKLLYRSAHNRKLLIESRGNHLITGAMNLLSGIRDSYGDQVAEEMERRLISSIKNKDPQKFSRAARRLT